LVKKGGFDFSFLSFLAFGVLFLNDLYCKVQEFTKTPGTI
jgi:hypothetical protein